MARTLHTNTAPTAQQQQLAHLPDVLEKRHLQILFNSCKQTVERNLRRGLLPKPLPLPGRRRWSKQIIERWLASNGKR
jgi:hypothetical protein